MLGTTATPDLNRNAIQGRGPAKHGGHHNQGVRVEIRKAVQYGTHDGSPLIGDLYLPDGLETRPIIIAVHGGAFQFGSRDFYRHLGTYLADHGYALFSVDYRLTRDGTNRCPAAINDVRAAGLSHLVYAHIDPRRPDSITFGGRG
jgi:acetyl esterase/lipase